MIQLFCILSQYFKDTVHNIIEPCTQCQLLEGRVSPPLFVLSDLVCLQCLHPGSGHRCPAGVRLHVPDLPYGKETERSVLCESYCWSGCVSWLGLGAGFLEERLAIEWSANGNCCHREAGLVHALWFKFFCNSFAPFSNNVWPGLSSSCNRLSSRTLLQWWPPTVGTWVSWFSISFPTKPAMNSFKSDMVVLAQHLKEEVLPSFLLSPIHRVRCCSRHNYKRLLIFISTQSDPDQSNLYHCNGLACSPDKVSPQWNVYDMFLTRCSAISSQNQWGNDNALAGIISLPIMPRCITLTHLLIRPFKRQ